MAIRGCRLGLCCGKFNSKYKSKVKDVCNRVAIRIVSFSAEKTLHISTFMSTKVLLLLLLIRALLDIIYFKLWLKVKFQFSAPNVLLSCHHNISNFNIPYTIAHEAITVWHPM